MSEMETALARCLEAAGSPEQWPLALAALARSFDARGVLLTRPHRNHFGILFPTAMEDAIGLFFEEEWHLRDLRTDRTVQRGAAYVTTDADVVTPDEVRHSEYYRGFAGRADVPWFAAFGIQANNGHLLGMSIQRRQAQGAFNATDMALIERVAPMLKQAMTLSAAMLDAEDVGRLKGLDLIGQAAVLLGDDGAVLGMNRAAEALMGTGIRRSGRSLGAAHPPARARLASLIAAACKPGEQAARVAVTPIALPCPDGGQIIAQAVPVVGVANDMFGAGRSLLLLDLIGMPEPLAPNILGEAFGLTATEARVASLMSLGLPVKTMAERLGMTDAAVRFHIKSILPKAQVGGQAQFAAVSGRIVTLAKHRK